MSEGPDYILASREGLYIVSRRRWRRVADGYFFGVTLKTARLYVPAAPTQIRRLDGADLSLSRPH